MKLLAFLFATCAFAFNVLLPAKGKVCFHDTMTYGDRLSLSFQVGIRDHTSKEQHDVDFYILGPQGNRLLNLDRVTDGKPNLYINQNGKYTYCWSNEYSSQDKKDVTFHMNDLVGQDIGREINTDNLESQIRLLNRLVQDIQHEQSYIVIRERVHRNTAESTNERVKYWSIFQLVVVIANTAFQVGYLKRFFEVRSNV